MQYAPGGVKGKWDRCGKLAEGAPHQRALPLDCLLCPTLTLMACALGLFTELEQFSSLLQASPLCFGL